MANPFAWSGDKFPFFNEPTFPYDEFTHVPPTAAAQEARRHGEILGNFRYNSPIQGHQHPPIQEIPGNPTYPGFPRFHPDQMPRDRRSPMKTNVGEVNPFGSEPFQTAGPVVPFFNALAKIAEKGGKAAPRAMKLLEKMAPEALNLNPFEGLTPSPEPMIPGQPQTPKAEDAPKSAKDLRKQEFKFSEVRPDATLLDKENPKGIRRFEVEHKGKPFADIEYHIEGDTLVVDWMSSRQQQGKGMRTRKPGDGFGRMMEQTINPGDIRKMLVAFRDMHPEVSKISGHRISGARHSLGPTRRVEPYAKAKMIERDLNTILPPANVIDHPNMGEAFDRENMREFDERQAEIAEHNAVVEAAMARRDKAKEIVANFGRPQSVTPENNVEFQLRDTLTQHGFNFRKPTVVIDNVIQPFSSQDFSGVMTTNPETGYTEIELAPFGGDGLVRVPFESTRQAMAFLEASRRLEIKPTRDFLIGAANKMYEVLGRDPRGPSGLD